MKTMTPSTVDALELIRADHRRVRDLFREFESGDRATRRRVSERALEELDAHAQMEEKLFYPVVARKVRGAAPLVLDSKEAHHVAKVLLLELKLIPYGPRFEAKFKQLILGVLAHMEEEEGQLLPLVERSSLDIEKLGGTMSAFKSAYFYGERATGIGAGLGGVATLGLAAALAYGFYAMFSAEAE